jgi:prephenate dehydrogenase
MPTITIIGLGLIGTSIGLAIKNSHLKNTTIIGHEIHRATAIKSKKLKAVDNVEQYLPTAVENAHLVILATPVMAIQTIFRDIAPHLKPGTIVTDTASTKSAVMQWADEILPASVSFIGGHPMAGKTDSGPDAADAALFTNAIYCLTPSKKAERKSVEAIEGLAKAIGAYPYFIDPGEHDGYVAGISHLPIALSAALVQATAKSPSWPEMSKLASSGFRDVSRLALGDPIMNHDIFVSNRAAISHWISALITELNGMQKLLEEPPNTTNDSKIQSMFRDVWEKRLNWMTGADAQSNPLDELPSAGESLARSLAGEWVVRRLDDLDPFSENNSKSKLESTKPKRKGWLRR